MTTATLPAATPVTRTGLEVAAARATVVSGDDKFANTGKQLLLYRNDSGGPITVTIVTPTAKQPSDNVGSLTVANPTVVVADGESQLIGPFKPSIYNDAEGYVQVTSATDADFTVEVVEVGTYAANA